MSLIVKEERERERERGGRRERQRKSSIIIIHNNYRNLQVPEFKVLEKIALENGSG
jgi:hypothetical protein